MMNIMNPPADWSTLKKLIWLRGTPITGGEELTVSGTPPLSLPNSLGKPLKAWSVDVLPKQDLHGYDAPWPAGGGANKLDLEAYIASRTSDYSVDANGWITINSMSRAGLYANSCPVGPFTNGSILIEIDASRTTATNVAIRALLNGLAVAQSTTTIINRSFDAISFNWSDEGQATVRVSVVDATSITSWSPYSNICPIHGTDKLTIYTDSKYGGLVEWNQRINTATGGQGVNATRNTDGSFTLRGTTSTTFSNFIGNVQLTVGHRYVCTAKIVENPNNLPLVINANVNVNSKVVTPDGYICTVINTGVVGVGASGMTANADYSGVKLFYNLFDVTLMFGAGNEPTSVSAFRELFPLDYYAYNAGQQMTVDQVNGAQYSPAVLTLPQTVYTGTIGSEGGESRWGEVDLGTLSWRYESAWGAFASNITDAKRVNSAHEANWLSSIFYRKGSHFSGSTAPDLSMDVNSMAHKEGTITIRDYEYGTDENAFTTAMSGVQLVYELATPTTFAVSSPTIPTPKGTATTWATAEDGIVDGMEATYVGKA